MAIGALTFTRIVRLTFLVTLVFLLSIFRSTADDQIVKNDGTVISGQIIGVSDGQVTMQSKTTLGGTATVPYDLTDIKSVTMAVPESVAAVQAPGTPASAVIAALEPAVKQFAGLPADWVLAAMAQLAEAYDSQGQAALANATYDKISKLYPGSSYENVAKAGKAEMSLKAGRIDEALAAVQPLVDKANQDIAPSPSDGALYAKAFLVYGQVLEKQNKPQQALEAYLTVKTMFYQNPALVDQADQLAKSLRDRSPGLGVD